MNSRVKTAMLFCALFAISFSLSAQAFLPPFEGFSMKKTTYVTMKDGTEMEGNMKNMKRKKGLISQVWLKVDGEVNKIPAEDIANMYVPASGLEKFAVSMEQASDSRTWKSDGIEQERLKEGYAYYEFSEVLHKKETRKLLLQLLNPGFANGIRVYHDPFATETASAGFGGIQVAGGDAKSYYVKKGDEKAFRLKKKDYEEAFAKLFGDCESVLNSIEKGPRWVDFPVHAYEYADCE
jgi:hypothetical protein